MAFSDLDAPFQMLAVRSCVDCPVARLGKSRLRACAACCRMRLDKIGKHAEFFFDTHDPLPRIVRQDRAKVSLAQVDLSLTTKSRGETWKGSQLAS